MPKKIVIIGGGISGCALLHFLKQKYANRQDIDILLLEKNDQLGGTIQTVVKDGCLFETGPNGFLDSKPRTLDLISELGLQEHLVKANEESKIRYLSVRGTLYQFPTNPKKFLSFKLLNILQKLRILGEIFIPCGNHPEESVYDFGKRRFGEKFSQIFLDPMVSGVYGGDARIANLKAVFPSIYAMEEEYGSLFKAMIKIKKDRKVDKNHRGLKKSSMGLPAGTLTSFRDGMAQLINTIGQKYQDNICLNQEVKSISQAQGQFTISVKNGESYAANELYSCAPAYSIGALINGVNNRLAQALGKINYAPIAVVGLVYPRAIFVNQPKGYGYLIPSSEQKEILGVLFEGNIFPDRCPDDQILFRVMIGGARYPRILNESREKLVEMASKEIESLFENNKEIQASNIPQELYFMPWARAIPQYDVAYCELMKTIEHELQNVENLHLVANYLKGVSLNDCIENAFQGAQKSSII